LAEDWLPVSQGQIHPSHPHLLRVETTTAARDVLHAAHETWYLMENPGNYSNLSSETKSIHTPKTWNGTPALTPAALANLTRL